MKRMRSRSMFYTTLRLCNLKINQNSERTKATGIISPGSIR